MYAINDNGTLRLMESLPVRLRLANGLTRTGLDELDSKQLADIGIYPAVEVKPEYDTATQYLGEPTLAFDGTTVTATYPVVDKTKEQIALELAEAKTAKVAELAQARWEQETGGLTLPDGTEIKTDREFQALLTGAAFSATLDTETLIEWKGATGWVVLTPQQVLQIAGLVRQHVQGAFSKECALSGKVRACATIEEVNSIKWENS